MVIDVHGEGERVGARNECVDITLVAEMGGDVDRQLWQ